jgi:hypothetical protein
MAEWKKVVVSGSNISQLNNDAGYLVAAGLPNTFATMSINGVSVIADSTTDILTFASASGAGLNIVGDAGADSITFTLGAIPNASLANSTISGVALGSTLNALTAGAGLNNGGGTYTGAATRTFSVDSGSMLPFYSSSIFATVSGDITITSAGVASIAANSVALGTDTTGNYVGDVTAGAGLTKSSTASEGQTVDLAVGAGTHITVNADDVAVNTGTLIPAVWAQSGSYTGSIQVTSAMIVDGTIVNNDIAAGAAIAASKINFAGTSIVSGSSLASATQGTAVLTTNGVAGSTVDLGLETTDSPQFVGLTLTGTLFANAADITTTSTGTATLFNTNATTVNAFGAATAVNIGAGTGTTSVQNNLNVVGNLSVQGTTTVINTTDLYVEDKFIILASGSVDGSADAGIIIDRGSDAAGNIAFGFDSLTDRWGYQNGLSDTTNAIVIGTNGNSAFAGYVFTEAAHTSTKPTTGEFVQAGAIYANTDGTLWMYA